MKPKSDALFSEFVGRLEAKLAEGERTYGDASFALTATDLHAEIEAEVLDICGWAWVLWCRLRTLRTGLAAVEAPDDCVPPTIAHNDVGDDDDEGWS